MFGQLQTLLGFRVGVQYQSVLIAHNQQGLHGVDIGRQPLAFFAQLLFGKKTHTDVIGGQQQAVGLAFASAVLIVLPGAGNHTPTGPFVGLIQQADFKLHHGLGGEGVAQLLGDFLPFVARLQLVQRLALAQTEQLFELGVGIQNLLFAVDVQHQTIDVVPAESLA